MEKMLDERYKIDELADAAGGYFAMPSADELAYGAADWKSCQRSGKWHTGRQWCVYRHKFKIHSVCSSFFFDRLDK